MADVQLREATTADVEAMAVCHLTDRSAGAADLRMVAYFDGQHNPQQALRPRVGYVALANNAVIGYIAGHRTTRHGCAGEVQYLFVAPAYRRRGIGTALLRLLAEWFRDQGAQKVCVGVAADSPAEASPFTRALARLRLGDIGMYGNTSARYSAETTDETRSQK